MALAKIDRQFVASTIGVDVLHVAGRASPDRGSQADAQKMAAAKTAIWDARRSDPRVLLRGLA